ncbi:MAG: bifunctional 4-hydroxy-2-oxoglutarate aldolase/2-dehydro-3-deoxy-phosphogluconate aldolase [Aestuariivita sp.]|nr:bifunctional 4-hydroxy-2-oxoglutarate aldolase/2-dehydro-3-deoxy-phosphogluconate aldolase [Aestuariivita sp.]
MSMPPQRSSELMRGLCGMAPVIPVLVVEDVRTARILAEVLVRGGLRVLEVTLRTPAALESIRAMIDVENAYVGAGTLLTSNDVRNAKLAGAKFGVSPGATDELLNACEEYGLPLLPGAATASEAMQLLSRGYNMLKFFPAEASGGVSVLKSLAEPLPQIQFCPTGGVNPRNVVRYLALSNVSCVGGSWVAQREMIGNACWGDIEALAAEAAKLSQAI